MADAEGPDARARLLARVRRDLEQEAHWLARRRLEDWVRKRPFDDGVVRELAAVCRAMHDAWNAGRYGLVCSAEGAEAEAAVEVFVAAEQRRPGRIAARLPRRLRLARLEDYPEPARRRLVRLGLAEALPLPGRRRAPPAPSPDRPVATGSWGGPELEPLLGCGCALLVLLVPVLAVVGIVTTLRWLGGR